MEEENNEKLKLRVFVSGGGCSGVQYGFSFDEEQQEDDTRIEKDGVVFDVDSMSFQYLVGAEIDYVESFGVLSVRDKVPECDLLANEFSTAPHPF